CAAVDADTAHKLALLDDCGPAAGLRGLDGGALSGRAGADHDEIVRLHAEHAPVTRSPAVLKPLFHGLPVYSVPPSSEIVRAGVLILQVIRMLPHIAAHHDVLAFHHWTILV